MNKAILMGRLTRDPEVRYSQSETPIAIARYTIAVNRRFKRDGEPDVDFINCVALGKQGEFAEKFMKKGQMICICGRIQVRSYDDQTGQKRWVTEIVVEEQSFAESKASFEARTKNNNDKDNNDEDNDDSSSISTQSSDNSVLDELDEEDLPF